jgi:branched-chain amino acid transport system permease protein
VLQTIVSGLESGSWFALLGLAIVVVMKAADVPNFAMAEMGLVATYVGISVAGAGAPFWLAVLATLLFGIVLGVLIDVALMRRLSRFGHFPLLLMTIGLSLALNALIGLIWGHDPRSFPAPWSGASVGVGGGSRSASRRSSRSSSGCWALWPSARSSARRPGPDARGRREPGDRAAGRRHAGRLSAIAWASAA